MKLFNSADSVNLFFFVDKMWKIIQDLSDNPKPECTGFYLTHYDYDECISEQVLFYEVPKEKVYKYLYFSNKKTYQPMHEGVLLSRDIADEKLDQYPGGVNIAPCDVLHLMNIGGSVGISGHESMVDEAMSALILAAKNSLWKIRRARSHCTNLFKKEFWIQFEKELNTINATVPNNPWIWKIGVPLCSLAPSEFH
jgi:hypothetical protein